MILKQKVTVVNGYCQCHRPIIWCYHLATYHKQQEAEAKNAVSAGAPVGNETRANQ